MRELGWLLVIAAAACGSTGGAGGDDAGANDAGADATMNDGADGAIATGDGSVEDAMDAMVDPDLDVLANLELPTGAAYRNVTVRNGAKLTLQGSLVVRGNLVIEHGGSLENTTERMHVAGNMTNDGSVVDGAGIVFDGSAPQLVTTHDGMGTFANLPSNPTASFTGLVIDNPSTPIAVTIDQGDGVVVDGRVFIAKFMEFKRGVLDIGADNQFVMRKEVVSTRVAGGLLRGFGPGGGGQMTKLFPKNGSTFTFHLVDNRGTFEYSPVTVTMTEQSYENLAVVTSVFDDVHPKLTMGGTPVASTSRYWLVIARPIDGSTYTGHMTFGYQPSDVTGNEAELHASFYETTTSSWTQFAPVANATAHTVGFDLTETTFPLTGTHVIGRTQ